MGFINTAVLLFAWTNIAFPTTNTKPDLSAIIGSDNLESSVSPELEPSTHALSITPARTYLQLLSEIRGINNDLHGIVKALNRYSKADLRSRPALTTAIQTTSKNIGALNAKIKKEKEHLIGKEDGNVIKRIVSSTPGHLLYHCKVILRVTRKKQSFIVDTYRDDLREVLFLNLSDEIKEMGQHLPNLVSDSITRNELHKTFKRVNEDLDKTRRALAKIRN